MGLRNFIFIRRGCRTPLSTYHKNGRRREHIEVLGEVKAQEWMMNPLSPQCRWDARHRMPLRKLKDHEERCVPLPQGGSNIINTTIMQTL